MTQTRLDQGPGGVLPDVQGQKVNSSFNKNFVFCVPR